MCGSNFTQKMVNNSMIFATYLLVLFSVTLFLVLFYHCKKLVKYFIENNKSHLKGIVASMIDRGLICFLSGLTHRVLIDQPNLQLLALIGIEFSWMIIRFFMMKKGAYESKWLASIFIIQGMLRITLFISFYLY